MSEAKYPIKATETTLTIIEELKSEDGGRVTELAESLDLAKSAVHNHLSTLMEHGYVIKEGNVYHLSLKFLEIGGYQSTRQARVRLLYVPSDEPAGTRLSIELDRGPRSVGVDSARQRSIHSVVCNPV